MITLMANTSYTYRVSVCTNSLIKIYLTQEDLENKENSDIDKNLQLIFSISDMEFMHGTIAFSSQSIDNLLLDDISIKQLDCIDFNYSIKKIWLFQLACL